MKALNSLCDCGSGKLFKRCHGKPLPAKSQYSNGIKLPTTLTPKKSYKDIRLIEPIIEEQLEAGTRTYPSERLSDSSSKISFEQRKKILDKCAILSDENDQIVGRSNMCLQFAILLKHILKRLSINSKIYTGWAYFPQSKEKFVWKHSWIATENNEIIDGNADSMIENTCVPKGINPDPFWGLKKEFPDDRIFYNETEFTEECERKLILNEPEIIGWKNKLDSIF